jgi:hypothetical protein
MVNAMARVFGTAIQSYLLDFLPLPPSEYFSEAIIFVCRLLGCATIFGVAAFSIQHTGTLPASRIFLFALLVLTVAVLIGNLIKEVGILIGGIALNWRGLEFRRTRLTLSGAQMTEVYRPDGTWDRYVRESLHTTHEWSDLQGECHRKILDRGAPGAHFAQLSDHISR